MTEQEERDLRWLQAVEKIAEALTRISSCVSSDNLVRPPELNLSNREKK